jgi:hypothetical protein
MAPFAQVFINKWKHYITSTFNKTAYYKYLQLKDCLDTSKTSKYLIELGTFFVV